MNFGLWNDAFVRLLCVEPNRRMNIDEFLEHGWILNNNIPDTVLFTSKRISDDVSIVYSFYSAGTPSRKVSLGFLL